MNPRTSEFVLFLFSAERSERQQNALRFLLYDSFGVCVLIADIKPKQPIPTTSMKKKNNVKSWLQNKIDTL